MRILDLFCGAGGAAMGYHRAGFDVVGVDIKPQPHYPFEFHQADALMLLRGEVRWDPAGLTRFDTIHASPPCQAHTSISKWRAMGRPDDRGHADLLTPTRRLLDQTGLPWVIENVPGAPMRKDLVLCGSIFGLGVRRHRWFEFKAGTPTLVAPCTHEESAIGVYGHGGEHYQPMSVWQEAMGIDWMTRDELAQAIPPAYTEHIGRALLEHLTAVAA